MTTLTLYLLRHTEVAVKGICYGRSDVELAATWREQFRTVKAKLPTLAQYPDRVYASPLSRCRQLAEFLYPKVSYDERLQELDFGDWEGQAWDAIPIDQLRAWGDDYAGRAPPGGEYFSQLIERSQAAIDELRQRDQPSSVVIVSHSGVILGLLSAWIGLPAANAFHLQVDYGGLSKVTLSRQRVKVDYINR